MDLLRTIDKHRPSSRRVVFWTVLVAVEAAFLSIYLAVADARLLPFHVYPFVWINLSIWVFLRARPPSAPRRTKRVAAVVAGVYLLVLGYFGGLYREGHDFHSHHDFSGAEAEFVYGLDLLVALPPGYGPAIVYSGPTLLSTLTPYMVLGLVTLAYLLYVTLLDASGDASVGLVGLFACVGCSFPFVAALFASGGATPLLAAVYSQAYALSTGVFALTIFFLMWRPFARGSVRPKLVAVAGVLLLTTATIHLGLGAAGVVDALRSGANGLALSVLFLLFGIGVYALVVAFRTERLAYRPTVVTASGLVVVSLVAYFDWHVVGFTESMLPTDTVGLEHDHDDHSHGHDDHSHSHGVHDDSLLADVGEHLRNDVAAFASKSAEFLALVLFGTVAVQDWVERSR